jgi:hypothetical protein
MRITIGIPTIYTMDFVFMRNVIGLYGFVLLGIQSYIHYYATEYMCI